MTSSSSPDRYSFRSAQIVPHPTMVRSAGTGHGHLSPSADNTASAASTVQVVRRVLTILAADVVDYTRLSEEREVETHVRLRTMRVETIDPCIVSYRGRIIKNTGDGFLACFDSPVDAVRCAIELQRELIASEVAYAAQHRIRLRIGLNVGEVIAEPEDIFGTSVNVAARLEQFSPPGGVVLSADVLALVKSAIASSFEDIGELELKNLSRRVQAYSISIPGADPTARLSRRAKLPSIAILPFRASGGDAEDAYFAEGMVDDIIFTLASVRGLLVISRTSSLIYRGTTADLRKVGQDLGVSYVLSGHVRRARNKLRIGAELSHVGIGSVIWSDRYEGDLADLFELQERIATRIVWSIGPQVREAELKLVARKRPENMNAYDLLMRAIDLLYRMNPTDFKQAGRLLGEAVAADDTYATAYAYAALWQVHNINQGWTTNHEQDSTEAARLAAAAVERDPTDGFALAILGHTKAVLFREYSASINCFERALEVAPGNAMAWTLSSGVYSYTGQTKSAVERAERGMRLSPVDKQSFFYLLFLSLAHYVNGTYEESIIWGRKSAALNPRLCSNLRWLIGSLVAAGRMDEARHFAGSLLEVNPAFRLSSYAKWCPLQPNLKTELLKRLSIAGIQD
jgi:adenylate cyclase